jgi:hypothetical protein
VTEPEHEEDDGDTDGGAVGVMPVNPLFQVRLIVAGNLVIGASVVVGILVGKFAQATTIPARFWIPEALIVFVGGIVVFADFTGPISAWLAQTRYDTPSPGIVKWQQKRAPALPFLVYVFSGVAVFALASLVEDTGGVVKSPFVPFLTTPALFGPFVAKDKRRAFLIVVIVALVVIGLMLKLHTATSQWLYTCVTVVVLIVAGAIGALRLSREEKLLKWINERSASTSGASGTESASDEGDDSA